MLIIVIPAARGAILLEDTSEETPHPVAWDRVAGPDLPVHVNRALTRRVIEEGISVLEKEGPTPNVSIAPTQQGGTPAHSILCVPLNAGGQALGVIYLHSSNPAAAFSEDDLQLLAALTGLAAIAIENAR